MTSFPSSTRSLVEALIRSLLAALAVVLPTECVGCGQRDVPLCATCASSIGPSTVPPTVPSVRPSAGVPGAPAGLSGSPAGSSTGPPGPPRPPGPPGGAPGARAVALVIETGRDPPLPVWAAAVYGPVLTSALSAFKEAGRTDVAGALASVLGIAVQDAHDAIVPALPAGAVLEHTVAPSSARAFRTRGYDPVALLARRVRARNTVVPTLRFARRAKDQAGLGVVERRANLSGSLAVHPHLRSRLSGRHFLLIDDVVTTGSTLIECRRALESAGATVWGAATLSFAMKHIGTSSVHPSSEPPVHIRATDDTTAAADYGG
ncbi:ComF family protein [Subtercola boreus]|nr:phosphoribosyltransferase family protein [Subtercola boreus]